MCGAMEKKVEKTGRPEVLIGLFGVSQIWQHLVEETPGVETLKMWAHKTNSYKPLEVSEKICQH